MNFEQRLQVSIIQNVAVAGIARIAGEGGLSVLLGSLVTDEAVPETHFGVQKLRSVVVHLFRTVSRLGQFALLSS